MGFQIDFTEIIIFLLTALGGVITAYVIPWIKAKTTLQQRQFLDIVLRTGVQAAEQLYGSKQGQEKKAFVIQYLKDRHVTFNEHQIEAKVKELFGHYADEEKADAVGFRFPLQDLVNTDDVEGGEG